jgi:DNA-binding transcriptional LysR family regulator
VELLDQPQLEALADRRLDLALLRTVRDDPTLAFQPLIAEPLSVAVAHDHRLARRDRVTYADLRGEPFVLWPRAMAPETFDDVVQGCRAAGFSPQVVQEATSAYTILGLVAAGVGVSVLASSYAARSGTDVVFVPITDSETTLYLAWRGDDPSAARDNLVEVIRQAAQGSPGVPSREAGSG